MRPKATGNSSAWFVGRKPRWARRLTTEPPGRAEALVFFRGKIFLISSIGTRSLWRAKTTSRCRIRSIPIPMRLIIFFGRTRYESWNGHIQEARRLGINRLEFVLVYVRFASCDTSAQPWAQELY